MAPGAGPSSQEEWLILSGEGCKTKTYSDLEVAARQVVFRCDYMHCSQQKMVGFLDDTAKQLFQNRVEAMLNPDEGSSRAQDEHEHKHRHTWEDFVWHGASRGFGLVLRCGVEAHSRASMAPSISTGVGEPLYAVTIGGIRHLGLGLDDVLVYALSVLDTNQIAEIECPKNDAGAVSEAFSNKRLWRFEVRGNSALHIMSSGPSYKILVTGGSYKPLESWQDLLEAINRSVKDYGLDTKLFVNCVRGDDARVTAYFTSNGWHVRPVVNRQQTQVLALSIPNPHEDQQLVKRGKPAYWCGMEPDVRECSSIAKVLEWTIDLYVKNPPVKESTIRCLRKAAGSMAEKIREQGLWSAETPTADVINIERRSSFKYLVTCGNKVSFTTDTFVAVQQHLLTKLGDPALEPYIVFCPADEHNALKKAVEEYKKVASLDVTSTFLFKDMPTSSTLDHEAGTSQAVEQVEPIDKDWLRLGPP